MISTLFSLIVSIVQACDPGPEGVFLLTSQTANSNCPEFPSLLTALATLLAEEEAVVSVRGRTPQLLSGLTLPHKALTIMGEMAQLQITACRVEGHITLEGWEIVELEGNIEGSLTLRNCTVSGVGTVEVLGRLYLHSCAFFAFQTGVVTLKLETSGLSVLNTSFQQITLLNGPLISAYAGGSLYFSNVTMAQFTTPTTFPIVSIKTNNFPRIQNCAIFVNCVFISNSALILDTDIQNYNLTFQNCDFEGNTNVGVSLVQAAGQTLFSNCNWRGNGWTAVLVRELHGEVMIVGGEVTDQHQSPPFVSANSGSTAADCLFVLNGVFFHDINYTISPYSSFNMGLVQVVNCIGALHNVNITHSYVYGGTYALFALVGTSNGFLEMIDCQLSYAGGSAGIIGPVYGNLVLNHVKIEEFLTKQGAILFSIVSQLTITDLVITREAQHSMDFRPDLTLLGITMYSGSLTYRSILISDLLQYMADLPVFLVGCTTTGSDLQIRNIRSKFGVLVHSGTAVMTNTTITGGIVSSPLIVTTDSKARFEGVLVADMQGIHGVIHMLPSSSGQFVGVEVRNVSGEWTFRAMAATLTAEHFSVTNSHFSDLVHNVVNSRVHISDLTATDSSGGLVSAFSSSISLDHITLQNCHSTMELINSFAANLTLVHVVIRGFRGKSNLGHVSERSILTLINCDWSFVSPNDLIGLQVRDGSLVVENSRFSEIGGSVFSVSQTNAQLCGCRFEAVGRAYQPGDMQKVYGGVLWAKNSQVSITETTVIGAHARSGGAVFLLSSSINVHKSTFAACSGDQGGALYVKDSNLTVTSSELSRNQADLGGALYFHSYQSATVRDSFLHGNLATEGGAVKWTISPVAFINTTFRDNSAEYGADMASYPVDVRLLSDLSAFTLVSGSPLPVPLVFELVDEFGQVVKTARKTQLTLQPSAVQTYAGTNYLLGNRGVYNFSAYPLLLPPGLNHTLTLQLDGTDSVLPLFKQLYYPLHFRNCTIGEVYQPDQCITCPVGMYSFSPDDKQCSMCPPYAHCIGKADFQVNSGYWRSAWNSTLLFQCPLASSCLGGNSSTCAEGYEGKLCTECADSYMRIGTNRCSKCESTVWILAQFFLVILALAIYLVYSVYFTLTNNAKSLCLLRLVATHSQVLVLLLHLKVELPSSVRSYLRALSLSTALSIANWPYSCLYTASSETYVAAIVAFIWPMAVLTVSLFCLFAFCSRTSWKAAGSLVLSVAHLTIPAAIEVLAGLIPCVTLDKDEGWLFADTKERCWTGTSSLFSNNVFVPAVLFYGVIALIGLLAYGYCRKNELSYQSASYRPEHWYWEAAVLLWKLVEAITLRLAVFRLPLFQISTFFISAIFFIVVFTMLEPLDSQYLFWLTILAYMSLCVSYGGAVYLLELSATEGVFHYFFIGAVVGLNSVVLFLLFASMLLPQKTFRQPYRPADPPQAPNTLYLPEYSYHPSLLQVPNPSLNIP